MTDHRDKGIFDLPGDLKESLIRKALARRSEHGAEAPTESAASGRDGVTLGGNERWGALPGFRNLQLQRSALRALGIEDPFYRVQEERAGNVTRIAGREVIDFSSYDYLGLNQDQRVAEAAKTAIDTFGTSVSASRLVGGERPVHGALEEALATLHGVESCACFVSGVLANTTTIGTLLGAKDLVAHDALIHNSVLQGIRLSGAHRHAFPHNDWRALDRFLSAQRPRHGEVLVALEGLYSMDGDVPDLPRFIEVAKKHNAFLMVDEAHSIGVLGESGRGIAEHFGADPSDVDIWMGTLSKSLAGCGGYIAGPRALTDYLRYAAPGLVFSVGMSPALAAASLEALRVMQEEPERVGTLRERSRLFHALATARGIPMGACAGFAVVPVLVGDSLRTLRLSATLLERGVHVPPAIPPGVEPARSRLRFFINATHSEDQIRRAVDVLAASWQKSEGGTAP